MKRPLGIRPVIILVVVLVGGGLVYRMLQNRPAPAVVTPPVTEAAPVPVAPVEPAAVPAAEVAETPAPPTPAPVETAPAAPAPVEQVRDAHQLVSSLTSLDPSAVTADQAQQWKASLQQLIHQGPSSVPGIREFLAQNQNTNYSGDAQIELGYPSLRAGLLDALGQIGGQEATAAMLQTMQTTTFPSDIATLAKTLEQQAPGQYQGDILAAARQELMLGSQDQLDNANVGPLFQILADAAAKGTDVTADLQQYGSKWPYYASMTLAGLPNGAGVPGLMEMAQGGDSGNQAIAAQALAELAPQNTQALNSLLDMAKQGVLSDVALAQLAPYLGGRQFQIDPPADPTAPGVQGLHIANGNQDFSVFESINNLSDAAAGQRLAIINQLLQAIPSSDALAQQALQQQQAALNARPHK